MSGEADGSLPPLLAIVGPTGSGKSDLAVTMATEFDGEVVSADAYQLYRGMDVGTAKVDAATRARVPHHLLDTADPDDNFTLARFLDAAHEALDAVWARGRLPVLCGGSGQYVWALLEGWQVPRVPPDPELRASLEELARREGPEALHRRLAEVDPDAAARLDPRNARRVGRALEVVLSEGRPLAACQTRSPIEADVLVIGLRVPRDELYRRLNARTDAMFAAGFVEEVRALRDKGYGQTPPVRNGIGYKEVSLFLDGVLSFEEAVERMKHANHRLVRRQGAWFKPDDARIRWLDAAGRPPLSEARDLVASWLESRRALRHA